MYPKVIMNKNQMSKNQNSDLNTLLFKTKHCSDDYRSFTFGIFILLLTQATDDLKEKLNTLISRRDHVIRQNNTTHIMEILLSARTSSSGSSSSYSVKKQLQHAWNDKTVKLINFKSAIERIVQAKDLQCLVQQQFWQQKTLEGIPLLFQSQPPKRSIKNSTYRLIEDLAEFFQMRLEKKEFYSFDVLEFSKTSKESWLQIPIIFEVQIHKGGDSDLVIFSRKQKKLQLQGKNLSYFLEEQMEESVEVYMRKQVSEFEVRGEVEEQFLSESEPINNSLEEDQRDNSSSDISEKIESKQKCQQKSERRQMQIQTTVEKNQKIKSIENSPFKQIVLSLKQNQSDKQYESQKTKPFSASSSLEETGNKRMRRRSLQLPTNRSLSLFEDSYPILLQKQKQTSMNMIYSLKGIDQENQKYGKFQSFKKKQIGLFLNGFRGKPIDKSNRF